MHKKFVVRLSDEERGVCQEIIKQVVYPNSAVNSIAPKTG